MLRSIDLLPGDTLAAALAGSRQGGDSWGETLVMRLLAFLGSLARMGPPAPVLPSDPPSRAYRNFECWDWLLPLLNGSLTPLVFAALASPAGFRLQRAMTALMHQAAGQHQQRLQHGPLPAHAARAELLVLYTAGAVTGMALGEHNATLAVQETAAAAAAGQTAAALCTVWDAVAALPAAAALVSATTSMPAMCSEMHAALAAGTTLLRSSGGHHVCRR